LLLELRLAKERIDLSCSVSSPELSHTDCLRHTITMSYLCQTLAKVHREWMLGDGVPKTVPNGSEATHPSMTSAVERRQLHMTAFLYFDSASKRVSLRSAASLSCALRISCMVSEDPNSKRLSSFSVGTTLLSSILSMFGAEKRMSSFDWVQTMCRCLVRSRDKRSALVVATARASCYMLPAPSMLDHLQGRSES
jgi:hypothetical protein